MRRSLFMRNTLIGTAQSLSSLRYGHSGFQCAGLTAAGGKQVSDTVRRDARRGLPRRLVAPSFGDSGTQTSSEHVPAPYVSQHYNLSAKTVETYLQRHNLDHKNASSSEIQVRVCPFCHDTKSDSANYYKLHIHRDKGVFFCFRCNAKGTWWQFRSRMDGISVMPAQTSSFPSASPSASPTKSGFGVSPPLQKTASTKDNTLTSLSYRKDFQRSAPVRDYFVDVRKLAIKTAEYYGVGSTSAVFLEKDDENNRGSFKPHKCLTFPMTDAQGNVVRFKLRSIERKSAMRMTPTGATEWGLFGLDKVPPDAEDVILTEGEFDAMAVFQGTGRPAVSLPNGAGSLPPQCVALLERFKKIYLWMDDDVAGDRGAKQFSQKLGVSRCRIIHTRGGSKDGPKDANEALQKGVDLENLITCAQPIPHENILSFSELRGGILRELSNPEQTRGTQSRFLPGLNRLLKGHRPGELTIYSGHTGSGKTTLLSQISLDFAAQGVPTLWGSFEINNVRLALLLLTQFFTTHSGMTANELIEDFDQWSEEFERLPIHFMRFFGSSLIDSVIDAMEYAHYVHDVRHVVLDNLQFMTSGQARGAEKFDVLDSAVQKCRRYATEHNVHVSLVVHPRKENDSEQLQMASIFGSAKATQEADNVVILQRGEKNPTVDVRKNRFDGKLGKVPVLFDTERKIFKDLLNPSKPLATLVRPRRTSTSNEAETTADDGREGATTAASLAQLSGRSPEKLGTRIAGNGSTTDGRHFNKEAALPATRRGRPRKRLEGKSLPG